MPLTRCRAFCTPWVVGLVAVLALAIASLTNFAWLYEGFLVRADWTGVQQVTNFTAVKNAQLASEREAEALREELSRSKATAEEAQLEVTRLRAELSVLKRGAAAPRPAAPASSPAAPAADARSEIGVVHPETIAPPPPAPPAPPPPTVKKRRPNQFPKPSHVVEPLRCSARLYEAVRALHGGNATDMIMGANDGKRFDPAMHMDYWFNAPGHTKVFIEPVPPLFERLKNNTAGLKNVVALNRAVRKKGQGDTLVLYCWDMDIVEAAVRRRAKPLPKEVRQPSDYWTALCSQDRREVIVVSQVLDTPEFRALGAEDQKRVSKEVEKHIKKYRVPASTPAQIIQEQQIKDAGYVQVDVEGMDNEIVRGLPLGVGGFLPKVILYENHNGDAVKPYLQSHGYEVCCCLQYMGNNMVAVLDKPSWVQGRRTCEEGFRDSLESTFGDEGIDIVIGARDGKYLVLSPAPWLNYWANVPEHRKLFVEAAPKLVKDLTDNLQKVNVHEARLLNFTVLSKAIRFDFDGQAGQGEVFCWSPKLLLAAQRGKEPLPAQVRQPREGWEYLCAPTKRRALELTHVLETPLFSALSAEEQVRVQGQVEKHLHRHAVETVSVEEVIAAAGPSREVRYLQIHPGEPAGELIAALPFSRSGFLPQVITYGQVGSEGAQQVLESHGYHICCCVERGGSNMVATLARP